MKAIDKIESKIKEIVENKDLFLIDVLWRGTDFFRVLEIFIDNLSGITTEICSDMSREIEKFIDDEKLIKGKYRLDVSSPGVGKSLKYVEQFPKHIGRDFKVKLGDKEETTEKFEGKLLSVNDDELIFEVHGEKKKVNFNNIKQAKVQISF